MKSFILANDFCKTEHPLDLVERTSILTSPTPEPLSNEDMFNDLPLVYNLTPFISGSKSSNNLNKGWLEKKCALASIEDTIEILKGLRERYETHHRVTITDQALIAAANLASPNITGATG